MMGVLQLLDPLLRIIDKVVPDPAQAAKLKSEIHTQMLNNESELVRAASSIIQAEVNSDSKAARNWRPHLMYFLMGLIFFNGVLAPLVSVIFSVQLPLLDAWQAVPEPLWDVLLIGLGGYVCGRSVEKSVRHWRHPIDGAVKDHR